VSPPPLSAASGSGSLLRLLSLRLSLLLRLSGMMMRGTSFHESHSYCDAYALHSFGACASFVEA
jgi:hypothetical protein